MLRRRSILLLAAFLLVSLVIAHGCSQQPSPAAAAQAIEENKELDRQLIRAVTTADVPALMNLVWKDPAVIMGPQGKIARGWDRIYEIEKREYDPANKITAEVLEAIHVPYGDTLLAILTVKVIEDPQDASPQEFTARITDLRKKEGGKWVVVYNHTHILPPPAATEEK